MQQRPPPQRPPSEARLLPIINTTLNLVHGENLAWQQRKAESFSMTPLYCGNWLEGYRRSTEYGRREGITVGTAITISGAAANPNMGYSSSPVLAFLMSIFNVRLGAWLGNTNARGNKTYLRPGPKLALKPLFAEVFGLTNSSRRYVNLSDGGHFDNLGLYEVVLRRCRHVLVSDAGNDGSFAFEDLGNAIRKIRIDFGIPIEFKTQDRNPSQRTRELRQAEQAGPVLRHCEHPLQCHRRRVSPMASSSTSNPPCGGISRRKAAARCLTTSTATRAAARISRTSPRPISGSANRSSRVTGRSVRIFSNELGEPLKDASFDDFLTPVPSATHRHCPQTHRGNETMKKLWILPAAIHRAVVAVMRAKIAPGAQPHQLRRKGHQPNTAAGDGARRPFPGQGRRTRRRCAAAMSKPRNAAHCRGSIGAIILPPAMKSSKSSFFPRNFRGVGGALVDLEYERAELIEFNLFDNSGTFEAYVKGRRQRRQAPSRRHGRRCACPQTTRTMPRWEAHAEQQICKGELIRFRTLNGICNDLDNPLMGSVGTVFARNVEFESTFPDLHVDTPGHNRDRTMNRQGDRISLLTPDPQVISRRLFTREQSDAAACNDGYWHALRLQEGAVL